MQSENNKYKQKNIQPIKEKIRKKSLKSGIKRYYKRNI